MIVKRKLYSQVEEKERLYFLGEHKGKFGKGGTASGVVFTGKDVLKEGAESRLVLGPKGTNGGKVLDYANLENQLKIKNVRNDTLRNLSRKGVEFDAKHLAADNAVKLVNNNTIFNDRMKRMNKAIKNQKFNRSALGKVLKKIKIR